MLPGGEERAEDEGGGRASKGKDVRLRGVWTCARRNVDAVGLVDAEGLVVWWLLCWGEARDPEHNRSAQRRMWQPAKDY